MIIPGSTRPRPVRRSRRLAARLAAAAAGGAFWLAASASPAAAHTVSGAGATNYRTELRDVSPSVPGVTVEVVELGNRLQLANATATDAVVLGYQGEPYLRVGPAGVYENRRSPAAHLNASRQGTTPVPPSADPAAPPEWHRISSGPVARWHDHRVHWMGSQDPLPVRRAPGQRHVVLPGWSVPIRHGATEIAATGDLVWVPGPSRAPWLAGAAVSFVVTALVGLVRWRRRALAVVAGLLVAVDAVRVFGFALAASGSAGAKLGAFFSNGVYSLVAWVAAGVATWLLAVRKQDDGLILVVLAGAFVALVGGLAEFTDLGRSQLPFAWSPTLARAAIAGCLGLGLGAVAAGALGLRLGRPRNPAATAPPPPGAAEAERPAGGGEHPGAVAGAR